MAWACGADVLSLGFSRGWMKNSSVDNLNNPVWRKQRLQVSLQILSSRKNKAQHFKQYCWPVWSSHIMRWWLVIKSSPYHTKWWYSHCTIYTKTISNFLLQLHCTILCYNTAVWLDFKFSLFMLMWPLMHSFIYKLVIGQFQFSDNA